MTLKEQITEDMKKYMREKDSVSLNAVRMLKSEIKNAEILLRAVKPTCHQKEGKKILFTREEKVSFGEGSTKGAEIISAAKYQIPKTQNPDKIKINGFETADLLFI